MEMTSRLAANLAHELNNLLTPVTVCGEMLRDDDGDPESLAFCAEQVSLAGQRIQELAKKLQLIGSRRPSMGSVVPAEATASIVANITGSLKRNVTVRVDETPTPPHQTPTIAMDPEQFHQLVEELIRNAAEAMPQGGVIVVALNYYAERVVITVTDCGEGMSPETRARIFEPFFSTRTKGRDRGLGLAMVYGIVHRAAGTIACQSEPGRGTAFRVEFPLQPAVNA